MKVNLIALATIFVACSSMTFGQTYNAKASKSGYVLTLTDSIVGNVTVNFDGNNIMVKSGSQYQNFQADQVKKVVTVSAQKGVSVYYSGYFGSNPRKFLFEAKVDGEVPLLYREGLKFDTFEEEEYAPYFVLNGGSVYNLDSKKSILAAFSNDKEIVGFVKANKLKLKSPEDLLQLFSHYNSASSSAYYAGED